MILKEGWALQNLVFLFCPFLAEIRSIGEHILGRKGTQHVTNMEGNLTTELGNSLLTLMRHGEIELLLFFW